MANTKNISKKNYIIFLTIIVLTFLIIFYIIKIYNNYKEINYNEPIIMNYINNQFNYEELDMYLLENNQAIIYLGIPNDNLCRKFEKKFKKEIEKRELQDKIIYININNKEKDYLALINLKYDKNIKRVPVILIFKDKELIDLIYADNKGLDTDDVIKLLKKHEMLNE